MAISFEHLVESRSATPKPAGRPGNDTDVIRHVRACAVKRLNGIPYHFPRTIRRVDAPACLRGDSIVTACVTE
ncbi:hypothetical protein B1R94_21300 [Mycolicibacterium litorale]|nr:hypothetical protein B1R94_21300 [Mycolicibacterium litorale]